MDVIRNPHSRNEGNMSAGSNKHAQHSVSVVTLRAIKEYG